jgi:hypothetical protein
VARVDWPAGRRPGREPPSNTPSGGGARCHVAVTTDVRRPGLQGDMRGTFPLVDAHAGLRRHVEERSNGDLKSGDASTAISLACSSFSASRCSRPGRHISIRSVQKRRLRRLLDAKEEKGSDSPRVGGTVRRAKGGSCFGVESRMDELNREVMGLDENRCVVRLWAARREPPGDGAAAITEPPKNTGRSVVPADLQWCYPNCCGLRRK